MITWLQQYLPRNLSSRDKIHTKEIVVSSLGMQQPGAPPTAPLFDDTSTQHDVQQGYSGFNPTQLANDPMANMAFQYGTTLASQGREYVDKNVSSWQVC